MVTLVNFAVVAAVVWFSLAPLREQWRTDREQRWFDERFHQIVATYHRED